MSKRIIVTGCGTDVGKTVVSAILISALGADYWKPIASGCSIDSDAETIQKLTSCTVHPSAYSFAAALSPHHAARLEGKEIDLNTITLPQTENPLVIETAGGIFVPLNKRSLAFDLFSSWDADWIVVSRHYLGSINHTLLTLNALRARGLIFNGAPNPDTEEAIEKFSGIPCIGRLFPEKQITASLIKQYGETWKNKLLSL